MRVDALLAEALRSRRAEPPELGPSRLELERRRLLARLADEGRSRSPVRRPARPLRWAAAAAVAAACAAIALFYARPGEPVVSLTGAWRVEPGDAIAGGALVRVPERGRASLLLPDGTRIAADGGAVLRVARGAGTEISLLEGRIAADVARREERSGPFVVSTEFGDVAVMGTVFAVAVDGEGATVRLYEGRVRLSSAGRGITLSPGHSARASKRGLVSLGGVGGADSGSDLALLDPDPPGAAGAPGPRRPGTAPAAGPAEPAGAGAGSRASLPDERRGPASDGRAAGRGTPEDASARLATLWRERRYAEILEATESPATAPALLVFRGKALGALGRWSDAGAAFSRAAAAGGDVGREAAYLSATALHTAGDFTGSLAMSRRAAALGGPNADHASRLVFVSLTELGRYADAAASAAGYLAAYPGGAHVAEARFSVSTGARLARRWAEAATGYTEFLALGRGSAQMRDDAEFYVGYCRLMAGAAESGRQELRRYLASHPSGRHAEQARAALTH